MTNISQGIKIKNTPQGRILFSALISGYVQKFEFNKNDAGVGITSFLCKIKPEQIPFGISSGRFVK